LVALSTKWLSIDPWITHPVEFVAEFSAHPQRRLE
jgi:hypothetical protein